MLSRLVLLASLTFAVVQADEPIFVDGATGFSSGWENWSWSTNFTFGSTAIPGRSSLLVSSDAYAGFSLYDETPFNNNYAGMRFDFASAAPQQVQWYLQSTTSGGQSAQITLDTFSSSINANSFTTITINFADLPPNGGLLGNDTWNRLNFQALGSGATYSIDNFSLITDIVVPPLFLSAEPLGQNLIAATTQGAVDLTQLKVTLNNSTIAITNHTTYVPVDSPASSITYFTLGSSFAAGTLLITAGNTTFNYTIPAVQYGSITTGNQRPINPHIYGVNFPTSASYIEHLGVTISRWGGNAETAYNPFGDFTNAGNDWYFENRANDDGSADSWIEWVEGAGSDTMVAIPALDWVAKDSTSYSYPATIYPNQESFDPYNANAGDGMYPNGSWVPPLPQTNVYTPWNMSLASKWLTGLVHKPTIVTVDNEMEIASSTHQDMHPNNIGYDEELARMVNTSVMAKAALPNALVAAPSTCAWWFYWTSAIGYTDNAAHNNIDWLPWFLGQMSTASTKAGKRLLDYLDIHYYYAADTSANDAAAKALRLRMSRSLWDPTYVDESWIGTSTPQNHQGNPTCVWLIPRMQALIAQNYPGTKLSISEWSSTADTDITGGLLSADVLGIYGVYGVDSATYWATPDETGPVGLAYWLYNGYGTHFGNSSVQVNLQAPDYVNGDVLGYFASINAAKKISIVIVNKDIKPISLAVSNIPTGSYFIRHFGGEAGVAKWQTTTTFKQTDFIVVPAYTALFMQQQ